MPRIHDNTSRHHIQRIATILGELQRAEEKLTKEKLADRCGGVSERTIERDIRSMEALMNVEIVYDHISGYKIIGDIKHFPVLKLEEGDLLTLHFLRQCLAQHAGTSIGQSMIDSFERAFGLLTGTSGWKKWSETVAFRFEGYPETGQDNVKVLEVLHKAIREHRVVSFDYQPQGKKKERRMVEPHFIYMRNGRWYLYATKLGKPDRRTFAFPRMSKVTMTKDTFEPRDIKPNDCFRYSFGVVAAANRPEEDVVLEFTPEVAQRVSETLWHSEQKITRLKGGGVRLTVPFGEETFLELKPWLLSWGPAVRVIGPKHLAQQLRETILTMAKAVKS